MYRAFREIHMCIATFRTELVLIVTQRASCTSLEALQSFTYRIDTGPENAGRRFRRLTFGACFGLEPVSLR